MLLTNVHPNGLLLRGIFPAEWNAMAPAYHTKTWYMVHGIHFFFPFALKALLLFMLIIIIITVGTFTIWLLFRHGLINFCFWKPLLKNCYFCFLMIKIDHAHSQSFIPQFYFCCQYIREMNLQ